MRSLKGPGLWGRGGGLPGVSLPIDECGAEEEIEVAEEAGSPDALTWGGVRRQVREGRGEWECWGRVWG